MLFFNIMLTMTQFEDYLNSARKILITSHIGADPDALCSALAVYNILLNNGFAKEQLCINLEGLSLRDYSILHRYDDIGTGSNRDAVEKFNPDLIIVTDGSQWHRFFHDDWRPDESIKSVGLDHHQGAGNESSEFDLEYNRGISSACEEVYKVMVQDMEFEIDQNIAEILLYGIIADTGRFKYPMKDFRQTMEVVSDLVVDYDLTIEKLLSRISGRSMGEIRVYQELLSNIKLGVDYTYSYVSDEFIDNVVKAEQIEYEDYEKAVSGWINEYLTSVEGNKWGFVVKKGLNNLNEKAYKVSFRSSVGYKDVSEVAAKLGGGGHMQASGCEVKAEDVWAAIGKIEEVI